MRNNMIDYTQNIGKRVQKCAISHKASHKQKPFKSGQKINTIKGVIDHPILHVPAYTFVEDDSYVECRRCEVVNDYTAHQEKILEYYKNNPNTIIITAEQGIGKICDTK